MNNTLNNLNKTLPLLLVTLAFVGAGCTKSSNSSPDAVVATTTLNPDGSTPATTPAGTTGVAGTNTVAFVPDSLWELSNYTGQGLVNPTNISLQVNLANVGNNHMGGQVMLTFTDNGVVHQGYFRACFTGNCINPNFASYGTARDVGVSEANYNYWYYIGSKKIFTGFFQDNYGAIILVIDNVGTTTNQGDGQGTTGTMSGQVWYRNFGPYTGAVQSPYRTCWFIYDGPFACGSDLVKYKTSPYPTDSYRKLGTFSGLSLTN